MKLYAAYEVSAFESMKKDGYLESNEKYFSFPNEYKYMIKEMERRIKGYKYEGNNLLWFWTAKPDLSFWEKKDYCLISIEIERDRILISSFDDWNVVLNDEYFVNDLDDVYFTDDLNSENIKECEYYEWMCNYFEANSISKEDTWNRIFDKDVLASEEYNQVTTGKINLDDINVEGYYKVTSDGVFEIS